MTTSVLQVSPDTKTMLPQSVNGYEGRRTKKHHRGARVMETLSKKCEMLQENVGSKLMEILTTIPTSCASSSKEIKDLYANESGWLRTIAAAFREIALENCNELPDGLIEFGYQWAKSWPLKSLYLYGEYGSGKTTYAMAIVRQVMREWSSKRYIWPRYMSARQLDSRLLQASRCDEGDEYELTSISEIDLLFIDDFDKVSPTERFQVQLFEIINRRQINNLPTVITSNFAHKELSRLLDGAVISRMEDQSRWQIIQFPKTDLRKAKILQF